MNQTSAALLAIVEVEQDEAVVCQAPGCNHKVYKQVHVVKMAENLSVLGSSCFKKLFQGQQIARSRPRLTDTTGRRLTEEERRLLRENTDELIRRLEQELQTREAAASPTPTKHGRGSARRSLLLADPLAGVEAGVVAEAKAAVARRYSCNPELPGWKGLVASEVQAILKRRDAA